MTRWALDWPGQSKSPEHNRIDDPGGAVIRAAAPGLGKSTVHCLLACRYPVTRGWLLRRANFHSEFIVALVTIRQSSSLLSDGGYSEGPSIMVFTGTPHLIL